MKYPIELVIWKDAVSEDEWKNVDDITPHFHLIHTVGFVIKDTEEVLTVSLNHDTVADNFSCTIHIPQGMVVDRIPFPDVNN
jgi:hypothetical protein